MYLSDQGGGAALIQVMSVAAVSSILMAVVLGFAGHVDNTRTAYQLAEERKMLTNELRIIFSNPQLCQSLVQLNGDQFAINNLFVPNTVMGSYMRVRRLSLENVTDLPTGRQRADFVISGEQVRNPTLSSRISVAVTYIRVGNVPTDCILEVTPEAACQESGFEWLSDEQRCGVCEALGGIWQDDLCAFS